jgi:hypothetical protein
LGVAFLHKQEAFRALAAYQFIPESAKSPSLNGSVGVQGIGTGNPGYSLTTEKNWKDQNGSLNLFTGVGFRSNETHLHAIGGVKYQFNFGTVIGVQLDGHGSHPFIIQNYKNVLGGVYLIDGRKAAFLIGARF